MTHHIIIKNNEMSEILSLTKRTNKSYLSSALLMNSENEHIASDIFDVSNSVDTQIFAVDSDQVKSSLSYNNLCDNYLRENIGEPVSHALAYVIIYRPEDAIEFIANFLIDWSRKKARQKLIDQETNSMFMRCSIDEQQQKEAKHLLNKYKEEEQHQEIVSEHDKHSFTSYQEDFHIKPHPDDERESSTSYFQEQKQQTHRTNTLHYIHTHDTASGFDDDDVDDDEMKSNRENNRSRICHDGNLSSFTYFSKLRDKIIKCDES